MSVFKFLDPDGDSQMRSSSSSDEADSEAMFPAELDPPGQTPQSHLSHVLSPQLGSTPPQSQETGEAMDTGAPAAIILGEPLGELNGKNSGDSAWVPQSDFAKSAAEVQHEPGSGWNNKKARDEYHRAMMQIEDKGFSLSM